MKLPAGMGEFLTKAGEGVGARAEVAGTAEGVSYLLAEFFHGFFFGGSACEGGGVGGGQDRYVGPDCGVDWLIG